MGITRKDFECATCNKPVESAIIAEPSSATMEWVVVFRCHGQQEVTKVPMGLNSRWSAVDPYVGLPRRVFLRNWAGYTIRPSKPEGRRL